MASTSPDFADAEEAAFLAEIRAEPAAGGPRLVYADWLEERGDAERAEDIRAQVELARLDEADPRFPAALARARRCGLLTAPRQRPWVDHVPGGAVLFRRGLIAGVDIPADEFLKHPTERWQRLPLEQLSLAAEYLAQSPGLGAAVAARPELSSLHTLHLAGDWRTPELRPLLTGCPHLVGLRVLRAEVRRFAERDDPAQEDVARGLALPGLDSLSLTVTSETVEDGEAAVFATWRAAVGACTRPLRRLCLQAVLGSDFDGANVEWLFQTPHWPHLTRADIYFHVQGTHWGDVEHPYTPGNLVDLFSGKRVGNLNLWCSHLPELLSYPDWGSVRALQLFIEPEMPDSAGDLAFAPQARQLERLILNFNGPQDEGDAARLGSGPCLANLRRLSVRSCYPGLLPGSFAPNLLRLHVQYWYSDDFFDVLAASTFPRLRWLGLGAVVPNASLAPLLRGHSFPNLCTLVFKDRLPDQTDDELLGAFAQAEGMPHLSLVGVGWPHYPKWWVLDGGQAIPVAPGLLPVDTDWWETELTDDWY